MTVIRLQLDVDPLLHPELHRLLDAIQDRSAGAERLRQLAGTGLLWEGLRLQAAAAGRPQWEVPALAGGLQAADAPVPCGAVPTPAVDATAGPTAALASGPSEVTEVPAVELSPQASAPDCALRREIASAMDELPVLTDVIAAPRFQASPQALQDAPPRRGGTRSRLLRMKDKGLFRNE